MEEVPIIRCIGLNYRDHAKEANQPIPEIPILFVKPRTSLNGPFPAAINVPKIAQDGTEDYEAELAVVLGKTGRDIAEQDALDYVLGYTASNDVSARTQQHNTSQWSFAKGNDSALPFSSLRQFAHPIETQASMALLLLVRCWYLPLRYLTRTFLTSKPSTTVALFRTQIHGTFRHGECIRSLGD
jgi:2-keto-4-pentenoate hydratase/2-oxohepta-3-ene-1,7-dioic acid hydratase in catechol pathway